MPGIVRSLKVATLAMVVTTCIMLVLAFGLYLATLVMRAIDLWQIRDYIQRQKQWREIRALFEQYSIVGV
jgi:hypothetical protein